MNELTQQLGDLREKLGVDWDDAKWSRLEANVHERVAHRSRVRRRSTYAIGVASIVCVLLAFVVFRPLGAESGEIASTETPGELQLRDGSLITPLTSSTSLRTLELKREQVGFEVMQGAARFRVAPQRGRTFRVRTADVVVEVVGTEFTVERLAQGTRVAVERGKVRVSFRGETTLLDAPTVRVFESATRSEDRTAAAPSNQQEPAPDSSARSAAQPAESSWRELAHEGNFDKAFRSLSRSGRSAVRDEPGDLMLSADVARLSGHPREAVVPLQAIVSRHGADPRAPLAAFTLGRVLLEELGRPHEAALAFARARASQPSGPLSEDALAREVEAWSRAGDPSRAGEKAKLYVKLYPQGSKIRSVRRLGNLGQ